MEGLLSLYNRLGQPQAAEGLVKYFSMIDSIPLKDSWYEKLQRWEDALKAYSSQNNTSNNSNNKKESLLGQARCLYALGEWDSLYQITSNLWSSFVEEGVNSSNNSAANNSTNPSLSLNSQRTATAGHIHDPNSQKDHVIVGSFLNQKITVAKFGASACFNLRNGASLMNDFVEAIPENTFEGGFYR
jgi:hypothetical protein